MEQKVADTPAQHLQSELPPRSHSHLTGMLNGAGNGAMVGFAVPYAVLKSYHFITKKPIPPLETITTFSSVACAAIGALFGLEESKQIATYRQSLSNEVDRLHGRLNAANDKIAELSRALDAKNPAAPTP
jgi:hypothetical protein